PTASSSAPPVQTDALTSWMAIPRHALPGQAIPSKKLRPRFRGRSWFCNSNARSEALLVLDVHVPAVGNVVLRIERVRKRLEADRRFLLEHVVHTQTNGPVPRRVVAGLHVVVGHRTHVVARSRAIGRAP